MFGISTKIKIIYYFCAKSNIMHSSRIILSIFLLISLSNYSSAASCDAKGRCKYGGRCGPDKQCICPMNCDPPTWSYSPDSLFCSPRKGGRPEFFLNICYVLAKACELQKDVPLIKYDFKKHQCRGIEAENVGEWRLCSAPEDFMGPCGGSLNQGLRYSDTGGICLKHKTADMKRCECPQGTWGSTCQKKITLLEISKSEGQEGSTAAAGDILGVSIGASLGAGVLLGMLLFALLRKCWNCRANSATADKHALDEQNNPTQTSRGESELHSSPYIDDFNSGNNKHCVITIGSNRKQLTPTNPKNFAASERSSKRQRLNGSGDANNNPGSNQSRTGSQRLGLGAEERIGMRGKGFNSAPQMGVKFYEDNEFTRGLSEQACLRNEAYTI